MDRRDDAVVLGTQIEMIERCYDRGRKGGGGD